jgi:hypothetical protein
MPAPSPADPLTPEQLSRLPGYAQWHIEWLARRVAELADEVAELRTGPGESNVFVRKFDGPDRLLGMNTEISFRLRTAAHPDGVIEVSHGPGVIEVRGNEGALHITPQSSNMIRVRIGEY